MTDRNRTVMARWGADATQPGARRVRRRARAARTGPRAAHPGADVRRAGPANPPPGASERTRGAPCASAAKPIFDMAPLIFGGERWITH